MSGINPSKDAHDTVSNAYSGGTVGNGSYKGQYDSSRHLNYGQNEGESEENENPFIGIAHTADNNPTRTFQHDFLGSKDGDQVCDIEDKSKLNSSNNHI
ncbi:hypothetical protein K7432_003733 [Basidiobolus ranarum]|uniref:Uncharacterized protein n=1 Tax=Basidiobolus ranarum TaxID=34480 RepID=A0ABR2WZD0_9FUNG